MNSLFTAVALVFILEGLLPFIAPKTWRGVFEKIVKLSDGQIRFYGLLSIAIGLILLWLFG